MRTVAQQTCSLQRKLVAILNRQKVTAGAVLAVLANPESSRQSIKLGTFFN